MNTGRAELHTFPSLKFYIRKPLPKSLHERYCSEHAYFEADGRWQTHYAHGKRFDSFSEAEEKMKSIIEEAKKGFNVSSYNAGLEIVNSDDAYHQHIAFMKSLPPLNFP